MTAGRAEIIAEVANAHQGDPDAALRLALAGLRAGADAVKFQIYFADELLVRAHPRFDHFKKQSFAPEVWARLIGEAKAAGARVICDVFGMRALRTAENCGAAGYKAHTSDLGNVPLLRALHETEKPVYLSSGGSTAREIAHALRVLGAGEGRRRVLMHGYQSFPTPVADARLARLDWLREHFGGVCEIGYQDHADGDDPFAFHLPLMALARGASVIEKHITFDRAAKGVDYYSSLTPDEFTAFVRAARTAEAALSGGPLSFAPTEAAYRRDMKKFWVTARALPAGHVLGEDDLAARRTAPGSGPPDTAERSKFLGRALLAGAKAEQPLSRADVRQTVAVAVPARTASSRMPGKALADAAGRPAVLHLLERLKRARTPDDIVLCTTEKAEDDALAGLAARAGVRLHRGPAEDVLGRMLGAFKDRSADVIVRVTGDDILVDPDYLDAAVRHHLRSNAEHTLVHDLPSGAESEVFDAEALRQIHAHAADPDGTEYLTWYVTRNGGQFRRTELPVPARHARSWRLTIDTPEDHKTVCAFLQEMADRGKALDYTMDDITAFFGARPELLKISGQAAKRSRPAAVDTSINWGAFARKGAG